MSLPELVSIAWDPRGSGSKNATCSGTGLRSVRPREPITDSKLSAPVNWLSMFSGKKSISSTINKMYKLQKDEIYYILCSYEKLKINELIFCFRILSKNMFIHNSSISISFSWYREACGVIMAIHTGRTHSIC